MIDFDHNSKKASPEWLTSVLRRNGYLTSGQVIEVNEKLSRIGATLTSEFFELTLEYSVDSTGDLPSHCLMKAGKPEVFRSSRKEAAFYELVRGSEQSKALLTSFGTAIDDRAESAVILMEDKGEEFYVTEWPVPPQIGACKQAVRALAAIHATWWNSPALESKEVERLTDRVVNLPDERSRSVLAAFLDALGDGISKPRRAIVEQLLERYPRALERRIAETNCQTLVHGDAHFWNVLFPKDESQVPIWIDWQAWGVSFGAFDLAYMIGLHWFPERRNRFEKDLLRTYLAELHQRGIDYLYDDSIYDYRLQIACQIFNPIFYWSLKIPAGVWWPHLERAFCAFDDLDCYEFIE